MEVPAEVTPAGLAPVPVPELPRPARALVEQVKEYERAAVQAAMAGDAKLAAVALAMHPLVPGSTVARELLAAYQEQHGQSLWPTCASAGLVRRYHGLWLTPYHRGTWSAIARRSSRMAHEVKGVIARSKGAPVELTTVVVPDPGPGEALVGVQACGVCHTDLHYREGGIGEDFPYLLGHEAAGVVEAVGEGVTGLEAGDFVILNWRAVCGQCRRLPARPPVVLLRHPQRDPEDDPDRRHVLSPALGIGAFAEKTLVAAGQCTKVSPQVKPEVAGLLGCGVMAGLGAALNTGQVGRGDSVAVIGCGGVGCAAVLGARLAGARKIIAVDIDDRKLAWARELGATDTVNSRADDPVEQIQGLPRATAPTWSSRRSAGPRRTRRRSTPGTWPERWFSSGCRRRTCGSSCRCSTCSAAAGR